MAKIDDIEGIGAAFGAKLKEAGVVTVDGLLKLGSSPAGRKQLEDKTGIRHDLILKWVNHADLYRIKGIGAEYSDLLECAGVDTVAELAHRNPENLFAMLETTNKERDLVRRLPTQKQVAAWVAEAKTLPKVVTY